jgi:hypothetical protein
MRNDRPDGRNERRIFAYGRLLHYERPPQIWRLLRETRLLPSTCRDEPERSPRLFPTVI